MKDKLKKIMKKEKVKKAIKRPILSGTIYHTQGSYDRLVSLNQGVLTRY